MKMKASRLLAGVLVCGAMCAAHGDTWTWTGAEDGYWTNAANWTVNGAVATVPPGMYKDGSGVETGQFDSSVTFGAVSEGNATTINLDGFWDVSNLVVTAAAPRYTFGASDSQSLTIHSTAGVFRVESGALAPTMVAQFGAWRYRGKASASLDDALTPKLVNNSSETLTFPKMFYVESTANSGEKAFRFEGTGNVKITGCSSYRSLIYFDFAQTGGAKLIWDCDIRNWALYGVRKIRNASGYSNEIEITEGSFFSGYSGMGPFESVGGTFTLSGPGTYIGNVGTKNATAMAADGFKYVDQQNTVNGTLYVQCRLESLYKDNVYYGGWTHYYGNGTTVFGANNEMLGTMKILPSAEYATASQRPTFSVSSIGDAGVKGPLGLGENVVIAGGGRLLYTGPGETCTRPFCITNRAPRYSNAPTVDRIPSAVLEQGGTGTLVFNSPVMSVGTYLNGTTVKDATLELANSTAYDAEVGTVLADNVDAGKLNVKKTGTGVWRLKAANTYTGTTTVNGGTLTLGVAGSLAGPVEMRGATFAVECALGDPRAVTLSQFTVAAGANTLAVADGATLTLNGLSVTGGSLDITPVGSGLVKLPGVSSLPAGVTLNGKPAEIDADGFVTERAYAVDLDIAAYGGRIPNAPQQTVGITSVGDPSDGPIALAGGLSSATVATLVQKTSAAATVDLAAGQTLSAGIVAVTKGAAGLTIGSSAGAGTFTVPSGTASLEFDNRSTNDLTVLAAPSIPTTTAIASINDGLTRLWWPANWAGTINLSYGTVALTNETDITFTSTLNGSGTFRKEGSGSWTLSKAQNTTFSGDFVVAGGQVKVSSPNAVGDATGALIVTNGAQLKVTSTVEFNVNKPIHLSGNGPDGSGAVYQTSSLTMPNVILDGDTRLFSDSANFYLYGGAAATGRLDMAGHTLTKSGANRGNWTLNNTKVDNPGPIIFEPYYDSANNWSIITLYGSKTDLGGADAPPIQTASGSRFSLNSGRINRKIRFVGDADQRGPEMSFTGGIERQQDNVNTNSAVWAGPIELVNANTWLSFNPWDTYYGDRYITVAGQISGAGGVNLGYGTKSGTKGHVIFTHTNNTYTGQTKITGGSSASLSVFHPGSIPDWSKITLVNGARVGMFVGDGFFTEADVLTALNSSASLEVQESGVSKYMPSSLVVDTTYAEGKAFTLHLSDSAITRTGGINLGNDGPGVLTVAGDWTKTVNFSSYNGLLCFYGNDHIKLGAGLIAGDYITSDGEVLFDGVGDISFADGAGVLIGGYNSVGSFGRMTIRDSHLSRHFAAGRTDWVNTYDSMVVGSYGGSGVLAIEGSSVVSNNYCLGFSHGWGALYMRNGHMTTVAPSFGNGIVIGYGTYGYFEMEDGTYDMLGFHSVGVNVGGQGVFVQKGGVINHKGYTTATDPFYLGYSATNVAQVLLAGGVFTNDTDTVICNQPETRVYFTVDGGEYIDNRPANANRCQSGNSLTIFNLNGGVFGTWDVAKAKGTYDEGVVAEAYLNFNGGTFRATGKSYTLFGVEGGADWQRNIDRVTVYAGGATIDVPSVDMNSTDTRLDVPLSAPTGQGVASVTWSDTDVRYVGAPIVEIIGDGTGASAMAVFDSEYGAVSGIMVTSPGCDYTWAKALIRYGEKRVVTNETVTLASFASGGFRKTGAGKLTLNVPNTYTGDTVIEGGELRAAVAGAIPSSSKVVMKGGTLTVAEGVAMPTAYRFDVLAPSTYPGAFTFPAGATMWIDNLDKADKEHGTYVLATFAGGLSGDLPTLANPEDLPFNWYVTKGTNTIRFRYNRGTILKFR